MEWLAGEDERANTKIKGLHLVHDHQASPRPQKEHGCQYDERREFRTDRSIVEGLSLERFVGPDGLMLLLSFLAAGEMPKDAVLELTKRVQIPGYEQTRELFDAAIHNGVVKPSISTGYYLQWEIQALLDEIQSPANPPA
ncbi:MAG TPA: hypothetical protein VFB28_14600 [Terriglobales bacterium]|nr:hypothetical protein [Terriglobales bacterium]